MAGGNESPNSDTQIEAPRENWWVRFVRYIRLNVSERKAKKQAETPTDKAARRAAAATVWMAIFTFVLAATSGLTIWILKNQLKEMHEGGIDTHDLAIAAKQQAEVASTSLRPWIKITAVELRPGIGPIKTLGFHWPLTGAVVPPMLQVKVSMLNVGHSVAQDIEVTPELFFGKFQSDKWYDVVTSEQQRFCKSVANNTPTGAAKILFPSEPTDSEMGVGGIVHDPDIMHVAGNPNSYAAASLIICVNYRGAGTGRYQTEARAGLYEDNQVFITIGLDADANRLRLIREPNSDHAN